jgi:putative DNA primase/helicase
MKGTSYWKATIGKALASAEGNRGDGEIPHLTDVGNGIRFARQHHGDVRFWSASKRWLLWNGWRWVEDEHRLVHELAKQTARGILAEAAEVEDDRKRTEIIRHAMESERANRLRAMLETASSEPGIPVSHEELDPDPRLLATPSGTVDLTTGKIREPSREDLITRGTSVPYDPTAQSDLWDSFLARIVPDEELRDFLQRACGYSGTGFATEDVLLILYGHGANGKTSFIETVAHDLGDFAVRIAATSLMRRRYEGIPNDIATLRGSRLVYSTETAESGRLDEARIKELTGGDRISARFLHGEFFTFDPTFTLWISTNHRPRIRGTDEGIWRRLCLVPFLERIAPEERDRGLRERLRQPQHARAVLRWVVEGAVEWTRRGLDPPESVREATGEYRREEDVLGDFLAEYEQVSAEQIHRGCSRYVAAKSLRSHYEAWCEEAGAEPWSSNRLGDALRERGFLRHRKKLGGKTTWCWVGLERKVTP